MARRTTHVIVRKASDALVVSFTRPDVIDPEYIRLAGDELSDLVTTAEPPRIVMDFGKVQFLSSAALGMLVALSTTIRARDGDLRIANVLNDVSCVFKVTNLAKLIRMHDTVDEAVRKLGSDDPPADGS